MVKTLPGFESVEPAQIAALTHRLNSLLQLLVASHAGGDEIVEDEKKGMPLNNKASEVYHIDNTFQTLVQLTNECFVFFYHIILYLFMLG